MRLDLLSGATADENKLQMSLVPLQVFEQFLRLDQRPQHVALQLEGGFHAIEQLAPYRIDAQQSAPLRTFGAKVPSNSCFGHSFLQLIIIMINSTCSSLK